MACWAPLGTSPGHPGGSTASSQVTVTIGLSHYGEPVSITVPPASSTTDLHRMFSAIGGTITKVGGALAGIAHRV